MPDSRGRERTKNMNPGRRPPRNKGKGRTPLTERLRKNNWAPGSAAHFLSQKQGQGVHLNLIAINLGATREQVVAALRRIARQKK